MARRKTSKRVRGESAEAPPEEDEGEPIVVGEEETITGDDLGDEVPGTPGRGGGKGRRTPTPGRAGRGSGGSRPRTPGRPGSGGEGRGRAGRGAPAGSSPRNTGAEIGRLHRRGMSLAVKFSLFISLLIILISSLFGLVVIKLFKETVQKEIIHSGYMQVLSLEPFATTAFDAYKDFRSGSAVGKFEETPAYGPLKESLQTIMKGDPRIKDIAIFAARSEPTREPGDTVVAAKAPKRFVPAPENDNDLKSVDVFGGEADLRVMVWESEYSGEDEVVGEPVYFFRLPISGTTRSMHCSLNLVLTKAQIEAETQSLMTKILIFGLVFVGAGIALSLGLASAVTSPIHVLVRDMDVVARGDLGHETRPQTNDEIGLLAMAFNRMTKNLREAHAQEREVERLNSELNLAKEIHAKLMPAKLPNIPGIDPGTWYHSAKEVGGDYYDFFGVDREHLGMLVADVSGKGIPGSMEVARTRTILRMMAASNLSPADVLSKTNHWVARDIKRGMFVTCMYAILNVRTHEMTIASAGHNPMLIWRQKTQTVDSVRPNGIALGFDKGPIFDRTIREEKLKLHRGDRVVIYTDGVVECMNEEREEWGDDKLIEFTRECAEQKSKEFIRQLRTVLENHQGRAEQHDDITVTTFRIE